MAVSLTVPAPLQTHLDGDTVSLSTLWSITRRDGVSLYFTDHDADIVVGGNTYKSAIGYERTSFEHSASLAPGNTDIRGILNAKRIDENDLRAGRYDYADVEITLINWQSPADGEAIVQTGKLGEVTYASREGMFVTELRDLSEAYSERIIETFVIPCRADIGDDRCTLPVLPDLVQNNVAYEVDDVVRVRTAIEDVVSIHAPGVIDDDDDSQFAAVGTTGSDATAADTNKLKNLAGNFRFTPAGGPTQNPSNSFISWPDADQHTIGWDLFTIEMWVNFDALNLTSVANGPILASKFDATGNQRSWLIAVLDDQIPTPDDGLQFVAYDGTSEIGRVNVPLVEFTPAINTWYHVAISRDEKQKLRIFVNGKCWATEDFPFEIFDGTSPVRLGMYNNAAGLNRHFEGSIEDFRITVGDAVYRDEFVPPGALASTFSDTLNLTEDYNDTNYRVTTAGTTSASDPFVFHSSNGPDADTGVTTLSVTAPSTFTRPAGSFVTDGFVQDMVVLTSGFTNGANNGSFRVSSVSAGSLVVTAASLVNETGDANEQMVQTNQSGSVVFTEDTALRVAGVVKIAVTRDSMVLESGLPSGILIPAFELVNGDAETGDLTGWTVTAGTVEVQAASPDTGIYAFAMSPQTSVNSDFEQTMKVGAFASQIDAGGETISVTYRHGDGNAIDNVRAEFDFLDVTDSLISTHVGTQHTVLSGYQTEVEGPVAIPVNTRSITLRMHCNASFSAVARVDNIVLTTPFVDTLFPDDEFNYGVMTWDTGLNAGLSMEIKSYDASSKLFTLYESMKLPINVGDRVGIHIGCNREASRCKALGNILNHRGFRFIPGDTKLLKAPSLV